MRRTGYRRPCGDFIPTRSRHKKSGSKALPDISFEQVEHLFLYISGVGIICVDELPYSRYTGAAYDALMNLCPPRLRDEISNDDELFLNDPHTWWYILNEMIGLGVTIPLYYNAPETH